jgi:predicted secreted Zn-dependent protease
VKHRITTRLAVVAVASVLCAVPARAFADTGVVSPTWRSLAEDPHLDLSITSKWYPIRGRTKNQIDASLLRDGTRATHERNAIAYHGGGFGVRYQLLQGPSTCELYDYEVVYNGKTLLPRWTSSSAAPDSVARWWHTYLFDIEQHEQEHAFIAVLEVQALRLELDAVQSTSSCPQLVAEVRSLLKARSKAANSHNRDFDHWTKNGRTGPYWLG